jgi:hypothetical protein
MSFPSTPPRVSPFSPGVSHRSQPYIYASPSTPPSSSTSHLNTYPFPESPSRTSSPSIASQEKHKAQLLNYQRDPFKSPETKQQSARARSRLGRLASVQGAWNASYPGRRLSAVLENGGADGTDRRKGFWVRGWRLYIHPTIMGRKGSHSRKYIIYSLIALTVYLFLYRPLSSSSSLSERNTSAARHTDAISSKTQTRQREPLRVRPKLAPRPELPVGVSKRSIPDHPTKGGLLHVDSESSVHPIYQLIRDGRDEWDKKVARQSKTLKQAVTEYKRRYGRMPPKGFDKWWDYVW